MSEVQIIVLIVLFCPWSGGNGLVLAANSGLGQDSQTWEDEN